MPVLTSKIQYAQQEYNADDKYHETIPVVWLIECSSRADGPKSIVTQAQSAGPDPLVKQFDPYNIAGDYDPNLLAKSIQLRRLPGSDKAWLATVMFDNTLDASQAGGSPFDRAPIDDWDTEQFQRLVFRDIDGELPVNSAGTALKIMADDSRPILTYTRNEASYPTAILTYQDAINSDPFLVFPAYTAKVKISASKQWENGVSYYQTKYTFHFRYDTWRLDVLNEGNTFRPAAGEPGLAWPPGYIGQLDEDGTPLGLGQDPTYKTFKIYRELPFAPLNIVIF